MSLLKHLYGEPATSNVPLPPQQPAQPVEPAIPVHDLPFRIADAQPSRQEDKEKKEQREQKELNEFAGDIIQSTEAQFVERFENWEKLGLVPVEEIHYDKVKGTTTVRQILLDPTIPEDLVALGAERRINMSASRVHSPQCVGVREVSNDFWPNKQEKGFFPKKQDVWSTRIKSQRITTVLTSHDEAGAANVIKTESKTESSIGDKRENMGQLTLVDSQTISVGKSVPGVDVVSWKNLISAKKEMPGFKPDITGHKMGRMNFVAARDPREERETFEIAKQTLTKKQDRPFNAEDKKLMDEVLDKRREKHFTADSYRELLDALRKRKKKAQ